MKSKNRTSAVFKYAVVVLLMIVYLAPLFFVFNTSLKSEPDFLKNSVSLVTHLKFQNYADAFMKAKFNVYLLNSLLYVTVCVTVSLLMAVLLAFPLSRGYLRGSKVVYAAFLAGMFLPSGAIPLWQMMLKAGLYNTRLGYMLTMIGGGGVTLFFFVSYIRSIPKELDEAAAIDGCGYLRYIFTILLPLMKPAISSMAVLSAIGVWNEVINSIIYLSNESMYPVTRGLYVFKGQFSVVWTLLTAALIIVAAPLVILYIVLQKYIIDGVVAGGVKA